MAKAILITGSTQGIGLGIASRFAREGFHVFVNYFNDDAKAQSAVEYLRSLSGTASLHKADVADEKSMVMMFDEIKSTSHTLESVVINAVDEIPKAIDEVSFTEWHKVLLTKLDGAFLATKLSIPLLGRAENPSITYITSVDGVRPNVAWT